MQKDKKKKKTVPFYIVLIILVILALLYETIRSKQSNPTLTTSFGYKFY
jgi:uncharacterized membrane protein YvbJ